MKRRNALKLIAGIPLVSSAMIKPEPAKPLYDYIVGHHDGNGNVIEQYYAYNFNGCHMLYNRELTPEEYRQNDEATKRGFGNPGRYVK